MTGYHADHVGSLLRPKSLLDARAAHEKGHISSEQLATAEDQAILHALRLQKEAGVDVLSDGEFRRASWVAGLYDAAEGLAPGEDHRPRGMWKGPGAEKANEDLPIPSVVVKSKLKLKGRITGRESAFMGKYAEGPFKVTMPGPTIYMNLYQEGVSEAAYPDRQAFLDDLVGVYKAEVRAQVADGAAYVQLDSLRYTYVITRLGQTMTDIPPEQVLEEAISSDNAVLTEAKAAGATTAIHICRGNHRSAWAGEGGYGPVAERLFSEVAADRFLLEFDDERSGGFEPLRHVPKGKTVVLGLITTKTPQLEDKDALRRRVDEAARYVDLENLAISPQCGFASTYLGNLLTEDEEKRKLELVADTARSIWG